MMTDPRPRPPFSPRAIVKRPKRTPGNMVIALDSTYHQTPLYDRVALTVAEYNLR
jgi:hypothetical protein